ncbi:MAG: amidase [Chloroflexi bacterium]|nr:amidase [Chloroflexota bacterium]MCZ6789913.1 amidase [Chloroflexota bacterium]
MELHSLPLTEMSRLIKSRDVSASELVESHLQRIDAVEGTINAFITVMGDEARAAAKEADQAISRGDYRGPLHGIPVAVKDLFLTEGVRTTSGTTVMGDYVPTEDATAVARLKSAGAVLMGKTNMNEIALGPTGLNPHYGNCNNPWDPGRMSGGSSGGSAAATATGGCAAALGTDTGGSVRIPASLSGTVGFKPTYGRISLFGVTQLCWSLDHVGIFTRTVGDCAVVLNAIAGYDQRDSTSLDSPVPDFSASLGEQVVSVRIGVPKEFVWDVLSGAVKEKVLAAIDKLSSLGASVVEVKMPWLAGCADMSTTIMGGEAIAAHGTLLKEHGSELDPAVKQRLSLGLDVSAPDYVRAQQARAVLVQQTREVLDQVDLIAFPTTAIPAPRHGDSEVEIGGTRVDVLSAVTRLTRFSNLTGFPAISIPCGLSDDGLPIGLQLVGRSLEDHTVLKVAGAYEQATEWHRSHPSIPV